MLTRVDTAAVCAVFFAFALCLLAANGFLDTFFSERVVLTLWSKLAPVIMIFAGVTLLRRWIV